MAVPVPYPPAALTPEGQRTRLHAHLAAAGRLLVAYSGGVDSAYLAFEAHQTLGDQMLAVIADSPSLPRKELAAAIAFAQTHAIPLHILQTQEMARPDYLRNDAQRCFHCKDELFAAMETLRDQLGFTAIAYGRNLDDAGDFRPGQQAAALHHAIAPLAEAGLGKAAIRALAHAAGLSVHDKPASACLSSRLEYGRPVTREALQQIEQAEDALHALGLLHVRVRHHGTLARIELDRANLAAGITLAQLNDFTAAVKSAGFTYVALDTEGYRSGSMNAILPIESLIQHRDSPTLDRQWPGSSQPQVSAIKVDREAEARPIPPETATKGQWPGSSQPQVSAITVDREAEARPIPPETATKGQWPGSSQPQVSAITVDREAEARPIPPETATKGQRPGSSQPGAQPQVSPGPTTGGLKARLITTAATPPQEKLAHAS